MGCLVCSVRSVFDCVPVDGNPFENEQGQIQDDGPLDEMIDALHVKTVST